MELKGGIIMSSFQVLNGKIMGGPVIPVESMKLLWKNDNATSTFAAQEIELLDNNYDFVVVLFRTHTTNDPELCEVIEKGKNSILTYASTNGSGVFCGRRTVTYVSDTVLNITEASYCIGTDAPTVNNDFVIPVKVYGFKKNSIGGDDHLMKYSTNEKIVGTWIDGKPIYQKVLTFTTASSSDYAYISIGTGVSVDTFIKLNAMVYDGAGNVPFSGISCTESSFGNSLTGIRVTGLSNLDGGNPNTVAIKTNAAVWQNKPVVVIAQYTKTTD